MAMSSTSPSGPTRDAADICKVSDAEPIYILGCIEQRVTIYSQQVRAIELARSLLESGAVRTRGRIAIVGAGIAGLTLAATLAVAAPELHIVLFEREGDVLHLQASARDRFVHPHIFDWPSAEAEQSHAGLPLMDWKAANAQAVAESLREQFNSLARYGKVDLRPKTTVDGMHAIGPDLQLSVSGTRMKEEFDAVVLSVGFGYERLATPRNPSYWAPSPLTTVFFPRNPDDLILVSGNGDGGLADFTLAAFNGIPHQTLLQTVLGHTDTASVLHLLTDLDARAWADPAFDLFDAYRNELVNKLRPNLLRDMRDKLRPDCRVIFHCEHALLFRRETALLNRFVAFLAIHADQVYRRNAIETICGIPLRMIADNSDVVELLDGRRIQPTLRLLRFGPDQQAVQAPFADVFTRYKARIGAAGIRRPVDPVLSDATRIWIEQALRDVGMTGADAAPSDESETGARPFPEETPSQDCAASGSGSQVNVVKGDIGAGAVVTQIYSR
jgi:hypothetical protein